jgi:cathepsin F
MIKQIVILFALITLSISQDANSNDFSRFQQWREKHQKKSDNMTDFEQSYAKYMKNREIINQLNANNTGNGEGTEATFGDSPFADMDPEEFRNSYLNKNVTNVVNDMKAQQPLTEEAEGRNLQEDRFLAAPLSYDWRTYGVVSAVKNQGTCGDCFAFASVSNIESLYAIKYGLLYNFAEQQILDCDPYDYGCNGGSAANVFSYLYSYGGLEPTNYYGSYVGYRKTCVSNTANMVARVSNWQSISTNEASMAAALYSYGPLAVAINATPLQYYTSGIINLSAAYCSPYALDHAVVIVGYGTSNGLNYWIVRNSWGPNWGEAGYFRIARGYGVCGINSIVYTAILN